MHFYVKNFYRHRITYIPSWQMVLISRHKQIGGIFSEQH